MLSHFCLRETCFFEHTKLDWTGITKKRTMKVSNQIRSRYNYGNRHARSTFIIFFIYFHHYCVSLYFLFFFIITVLTFDYERACSRCVCITMKFEITHALAFFEDFFLKYISNSCVCGAFFFIFTFGNDCFASAWPFNFHDDCSSHEMCLRIFFVVWLFWKNYVCRKM